MFARVLVLVSLLLELLKYLLILGCLLIFELKWGFLTKDRHIRVFK